MGVRLQLALLTALWVATVSTGTFGTGDTDLRLQMTHAWLFGGTEVAHNLPKPSSREIIRNGVVGAEGKRYIFYDPGQSILMLPGDWIGAKLHRFIHTKDSKGLRMWAIEGLVFLPLNVGLVLTCFWLMRLFGFPERLSALSSIIWLVGTTVLPYVQMSFQNNQVLLFALLSYALVLAARDPGRRNLLFLSGMGAGMAVLVRTSSAIHVFTAGLFLIACLRMQRVPVREAILRIGIWSAGVIPFVVAGRIFDYERYGSIWSTGQSVWLSHINSDPIFAGLPQLPPSFPFTNPASTGIIGVLFSSAKGIFIYDPLLLPCLVAGIIAWKTLDSYKRSFAIVAILNLGLHIGLTSKIDFWHGDWAWAARYHVTSVELLLVCFVPVFVQYAIHARAASAVALRSLVIIGIAVQALAVSMPPNIDITPELLQEPVMCTQEWNSRLQFRLAHRIRDLYCLESKSSASSCPAAMAARAQLSHPECSATIQELRSSNHLAFFPFDTGHRLLGGRFGLDLWIALLAIATAWTGVWFYRGFRRGSVGEGDVLTA